MKTQQKRHYVQQNKQVYKGYKNSKKKTLC